MMHSPFNEDELALQARVGVHPAAGGIRTFMPDQHREFFANLRYAFVATVDGDGWPLPTVVAGEPGFISAPTPTELRLANKLSATDPAAANFVAGRQFALLGLDLSNRRRNRANGRIRTAGEPVVIEVEESFGNCPQYISRRTTIPSNGPREESSSGRFTTLPDDVRRLVAAADTFFVATTARRNLHKGGLDISHRGGPPGFVTVVGNRLSFPDFRGNNYFNSLGNIHGEPRVGLLFIDFSSGGVLQLQGHAHIEWTPAASGDAPQPSRLLHVEIGVGWWRSHALKLSWQTL